MFKQDKLADNNLIIVASATGGKASAGLLGLELPHKLPQDYTLKLRS